ncbi:hypothetical protein P4H94_26915 [Paenibacillus macerans]|uniref:Uncharacterized protein n=1 Tax=Paenibacillus macerans TaxID=44252 RepID=A0A090ZPK6_PAEMA|nr:hypothetical protein [Paenibacillus macerans]KFN12190.1 hypothetical protein DJ90_2025 [Paenibacillus macerans]MBS5913506.1 hypothetical protein [Paenibacillus macerans]MCY7558481.1 hypothetical protein [Paenibacillus macerans]MDU5946818.1 hypothetical protein [Paenibacillus macerans]MEC0140479.1 hypothetical protein [Paenibacillus macerans]
MNDNEIAVILGTLIDADAKEFDSLEKLIRLYGLDDFFRQLQEWSSFSAASIEKLQAVQVMIRHFSGPNVPSAH